MTPDQPTATATPRTDFPAYLADAPNALLKFESMRTRRISDMTELWQYVAAQERELAEAKAEVASERRMRQTMETRHGEVVAGNAALRAEVSRLTKQLFDQHYADTNRADAWRKEAETLRVELARAEAEVARLIHDKGATNGRIQSQHFELTALRAEVAELRKDKARLTKLFLLAADLAERFFDPGPIPAGSPTEDDIQMGDISYEAQKLRNAARKEGA